MNHPQARQLWADTKAYLEKLKLEEQLAENSFKYIKAYRYSKVEWIRLYGR